MGVLDDIRPSQKTCLLARKKCIAMAESMIKGPLKLAKPMHGVHGPEISYYGFTLAGILSSPDVQAIYIAPQISSLILPMAWNYLDAIASMSMGIHDLLDEDNYRQTQTKVKGLLNIISSAQVFLFTYNPPLIMALGIAGGPVAFAGLAFALSTLVDTIEASMDYYNAVKEHDLSGWLEERAKEISFIKNRIKDLSFENYTLEDETNTSLLDGNSNQKMISQNYKKIQELQEKLKHLQTDVTARCMTYKLSMADVKKYGFDFITEIKEATTEQVLRDKDIQSKLDLNVHKTRDTLTVKALSFVGVTLFAVGTFAAFTACPPTLAVAGLAITVVVAALYIYRHQQEILGKFGKLKQNLSSYMKKNDEPPETEAPPVH